MYKIICFEKECLNKNIIYYMIDTNEKVMCGGCKSIIDAIKMTEKEFNEVFDYDPFQKSEII